MLLLMIRFRVSLVCRWLFMLLSLPAPLFRFMRCAAAYYAMLPLFARDALYA